MAEEYHKKRADNSGLESDPDLITGNSQSESPDSMGLTLQEMKSVLSMSPAGIGIVKNRVIGWANESFYTMLGYGYNSLRGKNVGVLFPTQKEYERVGKRLDKGMETLGAAVVETRLSRQDGTAFDCRVRASKMDPGGATRGTVVVMTDISEIKSLQVCLQQAQKMEAIGVLAGGVSHDFNNLLMGIQGHLSLMRVNIQSREKINAHIHQITKLVDTAADLTSRLLGFARGGKYQIAVLDINQVVSMALNIFKPTRKDIFIQEDLENKLLFVDGDRSQLEQVCLNLMVNGSQAMIDDGTMTVKTRNIRIAEDHGFPFEVVPGSYIEISIQDTGIGMDQQTQKMVFDPFFSTQEPGDKKGRGLGLSTVFGIVKNHGGFITVESQKGEGSIFNVCLPASNRPVSKDEDHGSQAFDQMPRGSETILLVDDEEEILNLGENFLEKLGYKPILARNGLEAMEIFKIYKDEISLVVLDLIMPKMGGKQTFSEMKKIQSTVKILVSTGFTVDEKVESLLKQGCHGFIQKPFSMNKFSRVIRGILDTTTC